jgi:hypothetical protein
MSIIDPRENLSGYLYSGHSIFGLADHHHLRSRNLVVKQANTLLHKGDAELLSSLEDRRVVLTTSWCSNVLDS